MPSPAHKADTVDLAPSAVESLGTPPEPLPPESEPASSSPRTPARKGILGRFLGAFRLAPKGFYPIPGSRHGGYHKQVNGRWVTWYPSDDHARRALRYHNYHAVRHYYDHQGEHDKGARAEHVRAFVDHQNHADGAEAFLRGRGKLKERDLPEHPLRGMAVKVTRTNIRASGAPQAPREPRKAEATGKQPRKPSTRTSRATRRADEEQVQILRSPATRKERKARGGAIPERPTTPAPSSAMAMLSAKDQQAIRRNPGLAMREAEGRHPKEAAAISRAVHEHDPQAWTALEQYGWLSKDMRAAVHGESPPSRPSPPPSSTGARQPRATQRTDDEQVEILRTPAAKKEPKPRKPRASTRTAAKAAPHEGLALRPSRTNPRSRRWQRVAERPRDRRGRPVQGHEVKAGAHFALERREGVRVQRTTPEETWLSWGDSRHEWRAPTPLVPQLVHDLRGELHGAPTSPDATLNRALRGEGRFLGKGDQGVAVRVGDEVVKAATIAPYHPENGIRSREQANQNLEREQAAHDLLAQHPLTPACRLVHHQGRTYLLKPYLSPVGRLSRDELEQVQDYVNALHEAGWDHGDEIELGRDPTGQIKMMDLGMARPTRDEEHEGDHMRLDRLFENHGQQRTPSGRELDRWYEKERMLLTGGILGLTNPRTRERSWARYLRAADAKGRALLDANQDDAWEQHQDEVRVFADQLEEERAKAGWVNPETAAGGANQA